jgi:ABC-type uncharacterized transport system permease subunit
VLPVLLVANVPTKLLVAKLTSPAELGVLVLMAIGCFVASEIVWRFSLRRYTSASS